MLENFLFYRKNGTMHKKGHELREIYVVDPRCQRLDDGEPFAKRNLKVILGEEKDELKIILKNLISRERDRLKLTADHFRQVQENVDMYAENNFLNQTETPQQFNLDESFVHDNLDSIRKGSKFDRKILSVYLTFPI